MILKMFSWKLNELVWDLVVKAYIFYHDSLIHGRKAWFWSWTHGLGKICVKGSSNGGNKKLSKNCDYRTNWFKVDDLMEHKAKMQTVTIRQAQIIEWFAMTSKGKCKPLENNPRSVWSCNPYWSGDGRGKSHVLPGERAHIHCSRFVKLRRSVAFESISGEKHRNLW